jgi:Holliday junction resolvase RusA-like endonuclease
MSQGFEVPLPPSANRLWRSHTSKKTGKPVIYPDPKYTTWQKEGHVAIAQQRPKPIMGEVEVRIYLVRKSKAADLDNKIKPLLDLMEKANLIENDKLVMKLSAEWSPKGQTFQGAFVCYEEFKREKLKL